MPMPISKRMRRWKVEVGRRSSRAPAFTVTSASFPPGEQCQAAFCQGIDGEPAILIEGFLLGVKKKLFAAAYGGSIEPQDTLDEGARFGGKAFERADLRDQANLQRALRVDCVAEQNERKCEARERVLTEVRHDGGGRETRAHLGKCQRSALRDEREVADDRKAEPETERVAVDFRDADQG